MGLLISAAVRKRKINKQTLLRRRNAIRIGHHAPLGLDTIRQSEERPNAAATAPPQSETPDYFLANGRLPSLNDDVNSIDLRNVRSGQRRRRRDSGTLRDSPNATLFDRSFLILQGDRRIRYLNREAQVIRENLLRATNLTEGDAVSDPQRVMATRARRALAETIARRGVMEDSIHDELDMDQDQRTFSDLMNTVPLIDPELGPVSSNASSEMILVRTRNANRQAVVMEDD
jgi:hypothetical protein